MDDDNPQYVLPHDTANKLILPGRKKRKQPSDADGKQGGSKKAKKSAREIKKAEQEKVISRKKQKHLQMIAEKKQRNVSREDLFEKLAKYRITDAERDSYLTFARLGAPSKPKVENRGTVSRNSIAGSRPKHEEEEPIPNASGPYFETDSEDTEEEEEKEKEEENKEDPLVKKELTEGNVSNVINVEESTVTLIEPKTEPLSPHPADEEVPSTSAVLSEVAETKPLEVETPSAEPKAPRPPPQPAVYVHIDRLEEVQEARLKLPILAEEQPIVEAIRENNVVVICGETGSGKTTQLPQFLYEAGYAQDRKIGITEPRRVAASAMSRRVASEMNVSSDIVSYQIRYEGNVGEKTKIEFMTDGVMLKEVQRDFLLLKYSVIIIDEAHERSVYSDILIGLLSRIINLRQKRGDPLKLIIMSATLNVETFTQPPLFKEKPPVLSVESRQFPVTLYFNRTTPENYLAAAYRRIAQIHRYMPEGGILVFVSGQKEVQALMNWLLQRFPKQRDEPATVDEQQQQVEEKKKMKRLKKKIRDKRATMAEAPAIDLDEYKLPTDNIKGGVDLLETDALEMDFMDDELELELDADIEDADDEPMFCLPLFSLLPSRLQNRVFQPPPPGHRLCVVATNIAETSLTIPNIKYVVDTGKEKTRLYDPITGISKFVVDWTSKASAEQRAGRAGRVAPGQCYRLYSSSVFNDFKTYSIPEILNKPVDDLVLQMKNMNITRVVNFPFPTPPDSTTLKVSEERLIRIGALTAGTEKSAAKITPLGRTLTAFPVKPQYAKMLALGDQSDLMPYVVCLVSILSVREPLVMVNYTEEDKGAENELRKCRRALINQNNQAILMGDFGVLLRAMIEFDNNKWGDAQSFCEANGLRWDAMLEAQKMRKQLTHILNAVAPQINLTYDSSLEPPSEKQTLLLRQLLVTGLCDNVARKVNPDEEEKTDDPKERRALKNAYRSGSLKDFVYIHSESTLVKTQPEYIIYNEMIETNKKYMRIIVAIEPEWLPKLVA